MYLSFSRARNVNSIAKCGCDDFDRIYYIKIRKWILSARRCFIYFSGRYLQMAVSRSAVQRFTEIDWFASSFLHAYNEKEYRNIFITCARNASANYR